MISIGSTIAFMIYLISVGKRKKKIGITTYVQIAVIAFIQVCIVVYELYSLQVPLPELMNP